MEITMYVGNEFIASLPVNPSQLSWPGYVSSLKRELLRRHGDKTIQTGEKAEFLIASLSPLLPKQKTETSSFRL